MTRYLSPDDKITRGGACMMTTGDCDGTGMFSDSHKKCWHRIWLRDTGHRHGNSLSGRLSIRCLPAVSTGRPGWSAYIVCISQGAYVKLGWGRVCEIVGLNFSNTFRCGSETWSCHRNTSDARNSQTHALIIAAGYVPVHISIAHLLPITLHIISRDCGFGRGEHTRI